MSTPNNTNGPFNRGFFAGATVVDFTATAGWAEQSTYLNITVVEDPGNDDDFSFKDGQPQYDGGQYIGTCQSFSYENFRFDGLLKSVQQIDDFSTHPAWKVTLTTPVEVLDATQVILSNYVGPVNDSIFNSVIQPSSTFQVSNLINVYGWAEDGGAAFGRSLATDIGMPWDGTFGIANGITILSNTPPGGNPSTNYGSYINYKNNYYKVDLSNLPVPPTYYFLGGVTNMSLLELLSKFFQDAGCDYLIKLTINPNNNVGPHTISFVVIPRFIQQQLGKIYPYILSQNDLASYSHGQELRSDITQMFLVGGAVNTLQPLFNANASPQNLTIMPFWGFDFEGNPIIGSKPDGSQFADDSYQMNLNATQIADIIGSLGFSTLSYPTTILELRCALGNYDTWVAYLKVFNPNLANQLNLNGVFDVDNAPNAIDIRDLMNDNPNFVGQLGSMFEDNYWPAIAQRIYEFVRQQADLYYGKKFIVKLPFQVQVKIDPTTGDTSFNNEIADAGFVPEGDQVLGLNFLNENFFLDQTGRFYPMVRFLYNSKFNSISAQKILNPDTAYLNGSAAVIQYNADPTQSYVFTRCEQGETSPVFQNGLVGGGAQIFFVNNGFGLMIPAMVVTIPDAIWAQADDITGSLQDIAAMLQMDINTLQAITDSRSTSMQPLIHPPAFYPDSVAIALRSNQFLYGPWGRFSANGKIEFEQDDGLVPWEYGGYDVMNLAAQAKIANVAMGNQVLERGEFVQAGIPLASLGDQLITDGPILTSIVCSINIQQVTTTYSMETFVNRAGAFIIENAERLKRIGKLYQQLRRTMRQTILSNNTQYSILQSAYQGFMYGASFAVEQRTPHAVFGGYLFQDNNGNFFPRAWTQTYQESLANLGVRTTGTFLSTACVGLEALFRPYTNDINSNYMTNFDRPDPRYFGNSGASGFMSTAIVSSGLNPIQSGCDITWLVSGSSYQSLKNPNSIDYGTARSLALRGPIIMNGWGYDIQGNPVPNSGNVQYIDDQPFPDPFGFLQNANNQFFPNYLQQSFYWPCGPLDIAWDKFRGVWAGRGMTICGTASGNILPGGTGYMNIWINNGPSPEYLQVVNFLQNTQALISNGVHMGATYDPLNSCWRPVLVDCPPTA